MYGYYNEESEIVWVTELEQLQGDYNFSNGLKPFIFARYQVVDHTCDKVLKKKFLSIKRAEEKKEKQLAYKKHAKCEVEIVEDKIIDKVHIDFSNVLGTIANTQRWEENFYHFQGVELGGGVRTFPKLSSLVTIKDNITLVAEVTEIELDKNLVTKQDKPMRLSKIALKDENGNFSSVTLFDSTLMDEIQVGTKIKLTDAQVNMRYSKDSKDGYPEGMKVPPWGSISIFSNAELKEVKSQ